MHLFTENFTVKRFLINSKKVDKINRLVPRDG